MDPLHINSPLTSECDSESEQDSIKGADETVAPLYEHSNFAGSGDGLMDEIDLDGIPEEDIDIPNYVWDKTSPPCSLWEHTLNHHGRPKSEGSITLHKRCPGCSKAAFVKYTIKKPQHLFTEVKVLDKSEPDAQSIPQQSRGARFSALFSPPKHKPDSTLQEPQETVKKAETAQVCFQLENSGKRAAIDHAQKDLQQSLAEIAEHTTETLGRGFAVQEAHPPKLSPLPCNVVPVPEPLTASQERNARHSVAARIKQAKHMLVEELPKCLEKKLKSSYFEVAEFWHNEFLC
ncbi:hypothetical protein M422DRAFT_245888 [Sphaerobolus stellatus SS14]|nr:hypothetical protein M422DRAFT_245888 [Sphaerobolus stellatus SS14]